MSDPVCNCHNQVMRWHKDHRRKVGGYWRCSIKKRESDRNRQEKHWYKRLKRQLKARIEAKKAQVQELEKELSRYAQKDS